MTEQKEPTTSKNEEKQVSRTIFSEDEIRRTVKAFVMGFIRGKIKVNFPDKDSIKKVNAEQGWGTDHETVITMENDLRDDLLNAIETVTGTQKSTIEEQDEAVKSIFTTILSARSGERIEGDFLEFELEKKIEDLEYKLDATNKVVEELVKWLIETEKWHEKGLS